MPALKNTRLDVNMNAPRNRKYVSPSREQKAMETKNRILDAAEALLSAKGFAGMTVAEVAEKAGVSPQLVYALFSSKAGIIMAAIEDRVLNDDINADDIKILNSATDPVQSLKSMVRLTRNIYEGNAPTFTAVYGARLVSPQLAELESELGELRRQKQAPLVKNLMASGKLLPHLDEESIRDIVWAMTSRELYHMFVIRRGWSPDRYEKQIVSLLVASLVRPDVVAGHFPAA